MPTLRTAHPRFRMAAFAGIAALGLGGVIAAPASAHDSLIASSPEADEVLDESPDEVVLEFSGAGLTSGEGITNDIVLLDAEDRDWSAEEPAEVEGSVMRTDIPEPLPNGDYEVHYRVVYSDGHSEELSFGFEVDAAEVEEDDQDDEPEAAEEAATATEEPEEADAPDDEGDTSDSPDPDSADSDEAAQTDDSASDEDSGGWGSIGLWAGIGVLVLALAAVVGYTAKRRRGQQP